MNIKEILGLISKLIDLEQKIEREIGKEKNAKKRKNLQEAFRDRDADKLRKLLFDL